MKGLLIGVILLIVLFLLSRWIAAPLTRLQKIKPYARSDVPIEIIAHRGGAEEWPENTMFAFEKARALGSDAIETDIHETKDGVIVIIHDNLLERTTNGKGSVNDYTWEELQKLDAAYNFSLDGNKTFPYRGRGIKIPSLEEALTKFPNVKWSIEIKEEGKVNEEKLINLVKKLGLLDKVVFACFGEKILDEVRKIEPIAASGFSELEIKRLMYYYYFKLLPFYKPAGDVLQVPPAHNTTQIVSQKWLQAMHNKGLKIHVWTINEEEEMKQMIAMGVDGIITDKPTLLKNLMR